MLDLAVKWLYPLRHIPFAPLLLDVMIRIHYFFFHPEISGLIDAIEKEVKCWPGVKTELHKYGGVEFRIKNKEIGHIHSNGLLDILFSQKIKSELQGNMEVLNHHKFPDSGWISFYIKNENDRSKALELLRYSYHLKSIQPSH